MLGLEGVQSIHQTLIKFNNSEGDGMAIGSLSGLVDVVKSGMRLIATIRTELGINQKTNL